MNETASMISGILALLIVLGACVVLAIYQYKLMKKQKEYIKNLNEHDKAVLLGYIKLDGFKERTEKK